MELASSGMKLPNLSSDSDTKPSPYDKHISQPIKIPTRPQKT